MLVLVPVLTLVLMSVLVLVPVVGVDAGFMYTDTSVFQAPPTFRTVRVGDDTKNEQSLSKEPHRVGPPATGPGHMTNEVVTSKVWA